MYCFNCLILSDLLGILCRCLDRFCQLLCNSRSKIDIIKEYPIEGKLNVFRKSFNSVYADSGYHEALDVTQYFNNESKIS